MTSPRPPLPRGPFVLLGLMTATTVLGPLLIGWVLRGGQSRNWPPDRPIEWATVIGTCAAVVVLMGACVSLGFLNQRATASPSNQLPTDPTHRASQAEVES